MIMNHRSAGIEYMNRGALAWAEVELEAHVEDSPEDYYAHSQLVRCLLERGGKSEGWRKLNDFYDSFHRGLASGASPVLRRFVAAELAYREGKTALCLGECSAIIAQEEDVPEVWYRIAMAAREQKDFWRMQEGFERTLAVKQDFLPAAEAYGEWLFSEGQFGRLSKLVREVELNNGSPGHDYVGSQAGIARLQHLLAACDTLEQAVAESQSGHPHSAALRLWPVCREHRTCCALLRAMSCLLLCTGWWDAGKLRLRELVGEGDPYAAYVDGLIASNEGEWKKALAAYDRALSLGLDHPLAHYAKACALLCDAPETNAADAELDMALERLPGFADARVAIAQKALERGNYDRVLSVAPLTEGERSDARRYSLTGPSAVARLDAAALTALLKKGMVDEAVERAAEASDSSTEAVFLFRRAMVYAAAGRPTEAVNDVARAMEVDCRILREADEEDVRQVEELAVTHPGEYGVGLARALLALIREQPGRPEDNLTRLAELSPERRADALYQAGTLLRHVQRRDEATRAYRESISIQSRNQAAMRALCELLETEQDLPGLLDLAKQHPSGILPLEAGLRTARIQGDHSTAGELARAILVQQPDHLDSLVYLEKQSDIESDRFLELSGMVAESDPLNFELRYSVAYQFLVRQHMDEAKRRFRSLLVDGYQYLPVAFMTGIASLPSDDA